MKNKKIPNTPKYLPKYEFGNIFNPTKKEKQNQKKAFKQAGTAAYGVGEGLLDTVTMGATDQITDQGYYALQKAGNSTQDEMREQDSIRGFSNAAGAIGGAIINPGSTGTAISQTGKGLGAGISKGNESKDWAQGAGMALNTAGQIGAMAYGQAGSPMSSGMQTQAGNFNSSSFGQGLSKYNEFANQGGANGQMGGMLNNLIGGVGGTGGKNPYGYVTGGSGAGFKYGGQMKYAMGGMNKYPGGGMGEGNGQVELDENSVAPNGQFTQFNEPSHDVQNPNQPNASLMPGEKIFSAKLKPIGSKKSFADLNKLNNTNREDKLFAKGNLDSKSENSLKLTMMAKMKNSDVLFNMQEQLKKDKVAAYAKKMGVPLPPMDNEQMQDEMPTAKHGGIHINPANKGKFTASAQRAGMGTQEFARHVLANKEDYSSTQVKRANFAHNAAGWKHEMGGVQLPYYNTDNAGNPIYAMGGGYPAMTNPYNNFKGSIPMYEEGGVEFGDPPTGSTNKTYKPSTNIQNQNRYTDYMTPDEWVRFNTERGYTVTPVKNNSMYKDYYDSLKYTPTLERKTDAGELYNWFKKGDEGKIVNYNNDFDYRPFEVYDGPKSKPQPRVEQKPYVEKQDYRQEVFGDYGPDIKVFKYFNEAGGFNKPTTVAYDKKTGQEVNWEKTFDDKGNYIANIVPNGRSYFNDKPNKDNSIKTVNLGDLEKKKYGGQMPKFWNGGIQNAVNNKGQAYSDETGSYDKYGNQIAGPYASMDTDNQIKNMERFLNRWSSKSDIRYDTPEAAGFDNYQAFIEDQIKNRAKVNENNNQMTGNTNPGFSTYNSEAQNTLPSSYKPGTMGYNDSMNSPQNPSNNSLQSSYGPSVLPWNRTNDSGQGPNGQAEKYAAQNPIQQFQEATAPNSYVEPQRETNPNSKNFDWGKLAMQGVNFAAQNAGNIYDLSRKDAPLQSYERATGKFLDPTQARRDEQYAYRQANKAIPGLVGGSGAAAMNLLGANRAKTSTNIGRINKEYENANAQIGNQLNQYNTEIAYREAEARAKDAAMKENIRSQAIHGIGSAFGKATKSGKQDEMDQETLATYKEYYNNPQFRAAMKERTFGFKKSNTKK